MIIGTGDPSHPSQPRGSLSSVSTTSLIFDRIDEREKLGRNERIQDFEDEDPLKDDEEDAFLGGRSMAARGGPGMDRKLKRIIFILTGLLLASWLGGLATFISSKSYQSASSQELDPAATSTKGSGKKVTLDQVLSGYWRPKAHSISWIAGAKGEDGLLLERAAAGKDYLVVEDVQSMDKEAATANPGRVLSSQTLMKSSWFKGEGRQMTPDKVWPSPDLKKVLIATDTKSVWRHSFTGIYWIFDVDSQTAEPLDAKNPELRVQLAQWSPDSKSVSYTSANNLFLRKVESQETVQVTKDGGPEFFYGIPDWVYEEEVFSGNSATWWSSKGDFLAFLRTNETLVPEYPVQFFIDRPSGEEPAPGEESYPEVQQLKYPKSGAPNPFVDLLFFDVVKGDMFSVDIGGGFEPENLLITDVLWANGKVLIKETNRVSDVMRVILVDVTARSGKTVRTIDVGEIDGGWFEISHDTTFIPADPDNGRPEDGYLDVIIHEDGDHIAYYSPMDAEKPLMLTSGKWEVDGGPRAIDLKQNLVYFVATKESAVQRHVYSVKLDGSNLEPLTDTSKEGYYGVSFSDKAGYALLTYRGPGIPQQKVVSTPSNSESFNYLIEDNRELADKAKKHELPLIDIGTIEVDGVTLNYKERRPPHFNPKKKYPVLFQQYSGPGSQSVDKTFSVDYQAFVAAGLGYVVVTVDGRGTGFMGRKHRVIVRKHLGQWEAHDQIAAAKLWAKKKYIDASRMAIWGWSYGGFQTLKTLETDAGATFKYGMAVAPVTDWRFYDSIYTERYMLTPQDNSDGYDGTAISNVTALSQNVRFLVMHGVADDNVHMQSTLTLLDKLDLARVENYDLHMFPDSNHGIYFHNANVVVYDSKSSSLSLCQFLSFPCPDRKG